MELALLRTKATRVNIGSITKDFMGFSFFRSGSLSMRANPDFVSLNAKEGTGKSDSSQG